MEKCKSALTLIPQIHYGIRRMAEHMLSIYYRFAGDLESAIAISRERKEDNLFMSVLAVMNTADQEIELGNLSRAHDIVKRKLDESVASFHEDMPMFFGFIYAAMGIVLREQNRLDEAAMMF